MRKGVVLLAAGGAAAVTLITRRLRGRAVLETDIELGGQIGSRCDVTRCPDKVTLSWSRGDRVQWNISVAQQSACTGPVPVRLKGWRRNGQPVDRPPLKDLGQGGFRRVVHPNQPPVPLLAGVPLLPKLGVYTFIIEVDGHDSQDPMVEIVI